MVKKSALYLLSYLLVFISALILFTCAGYYLLFFNWNIPVMGKVTNGVLIIISGTVSFGFYWAGHKLMERY